MLDDVVTRAASGHSAAAPLSSVMNSRRFITRSPQADRLCGRGRYNADQNRLKFAGFMRAPALRWGFLFAKMPKMPF
jgi:hypothetical protein